MCTIYISPVCIVNKIINRENFYVMGNENILFDPILFFSSNNLEELVEKAKKLQECGYQGNIYILPTTIQMQSICKEEIKNGLWSQAIPYEIFMGKADIKSNSPKCSHCHMFYEMEEPPQYDLFAHGKIIFSKINDNEE